MTVQTETIARQTFAAIGERFPHLAVSEDLDAQVEISLRLPVQQGLNNEVWLGFQNADELHFSVGHFWLEWFPCTDPAKVESYKNAVCGFLSGRYRVREHYRGERCFKAELQRPNLDNWETVGTWSRLHLPSLRKTRFEVLINA